MTKTAQPAATFVLSIEPMNGPTYQHPFHLGTKEIVAKQIAEEIYRAKQARTVALKLNGRTFDVFDGEWANDARWDLDELNGY